MTIPTRRVNDCPDAEVCKTCPCAAEDDVCFPGERLRAERNRYRALLDEFASHRIDSSLDWFDGWSRRVLATLDGEQA